MPAKSKKQRQAIAIAEHSPDELYARNKGMLGMSHGQMHEFAATKEKGLPESAGHKKHHTNPHVERGMGDALAVSDGGGRFQMYDGSESFEYRDEGPDEFQCDFGDRPSLQWPGEKSKGPSRRQHS